MQNFTSKKWIAIVGACTITTGLMIGGGLAAANAATVGLSSTASHVEHHNGSDDVTPTPDPTATPTPVPTHHDRDANDNDANDNDATEHATPEPGDDDAPGTADRHGGRTGIDDNPAVHGRHHGSDDSGSGNRGSSGDDGSGHDAGDDHGGSGHDGSDG
jgi:hypothetical protein